MNWQEITTLEDVYKVKGVTQADMDALRGKFEDISKSVPNFNPAHEYASYILGLCISAINGDWVPDLEDLEQYKYYCCFWRIKKKRGSSACGLSLYAVGYVVTYSFVAPHLYLESEEKAAHAAKYFLPQYENYYIGAESTISK